MQRARVLEHQGRLVESLAMLQELADSLDPADRPAALQARIGRLEARLDRPRTEGFVGISVE